MLKKSLFYLALIGGACFFLSCSSLKKASLGFRLMSLKDKKAQKVSLIAPPQAYVKQQHPDLDAFWWNSKTQSSISYFSACSKDSQSLQEFQESSFPEDGMYKKLKVENSQGALYSVLEIPSDQEKIYSGIYTLKKGKCYFNLNLVAPSKAVFTKEEAIFKTFIKGFHSQ